MEKHGDRHRCTGFDNDSGFGIIWADAALKAILELTPVDFDGDGRSDIGIYPFAEHTHQIVSLLDFHRNSCALRNGCPPRPSRPSALGDPQQRGGTK